MESSLDIARAAKLRPIAELAAELGLREDEYDLYGRYKLKIRRRVLDRLADAPHGREIVVTPMTPTPLPRASTASACGPRRRSVSPALARSSA